MSEIYLLLNVLNCPEHNNTIIWKRKKRSFCSRTVSIERLGRFEWKKNWNALWMRWFLRQIATTDAIKFSNGGTLVSWQYVIRSSRFFHAKRPRNTKCTSFIKTLTLWSQNLHEIFFAWNEFLASEKLPWTGLFFWQFLLITTLPIHIMTGGTTMAGGYFWYKKIFFFIFVFLSTKTTLDNYASYNPDKVSVHSHNHVILRHLPVFWLSNPPP